MIRFELPTVDDLLSLGRRSPDSVSIYLPTEPTPAGREHALVAAKSGVDEAIRTLRERQASAAALEGIRARWREVAEDSSLWGSLAYSLAGFISPEVSRVDVLPNALEAQRSVGDYFDLGQLVRSVTAPQDAYALTVSANSWELWEASSTTRATPLDLEGDHAEDVADATNRRSARGRQYKRRLVGDEGRKVLLDRYARTVADAVRAELRTLDPQARKPLFVLGTEPLLGMVLAEDLGRPGVAVPGASDTLRADEVDSAIRDRIGELTAKQLSRRADDIGKGFAQGLAVTDLAQLGRAAVVGAVQTMIYDFTSPVRGTLDDETGAIHTTDAGYDIVSRIAVKVLAQGGEVYAVRPDEIDAEIWNGHLLAGLRHALI